jgi:hypothetical protein
VLQKPKPNRNLKFPEKPNLNPTRPWVEDTAFFVIDGFKNAEKLLDTLDKDN